MFLKILVGSVLGFLSGLGIGGGSFLILWLTAGLGMEQAMARNINLLFFLPSAFLAARIRWKKGSLHLKQIWPAMTAGAISAAAFTIAGQSLDVSLVKKAFGFLLLGTGIREVLYNPKK